MFVIVDICLEYVLSSHHIALDITEISLCSDYDIRSLLVTFIEPKLGNPWAIGF